MSFKARVTAIAGSIGVFINISLNGIRGYFTFVHLTSNVFDISSALPRSYAHRSFVHARTVIWDGQKAGGTEHGTLYSPEALLAD